VPQSWSKVTDCSIQPQLEARLVRELPYRDPSRLVMLWNTNDQAGMTLKQQKTQGRSLSLAEYRDWQSFSGGFERMIVFGSFLTRLGKTDDPEIVFGYQSAPGFFPLLGVSPQLGRGFTPEDEKEGATPVVVLQHDFWKRRFHGDSAVLGKTIYLDNRLFTIVGVMPPDFVFFNRQIDFVSTATWRFQDVEKRRGDRYFRAMARRDEARRRCPRLRGQTRRASFDWFPDAAGLTRQKAVQHHHRRPPTGHARA